jgi:hypothetical protein
VRCVLAAGGASAYHPPRSITFKEEPMIIWGSGGKLVELGNAATADCAVCEKERSFRDVLAYRYAHVWYLFSWVTKKEYLRVCETCNRGSQHDTKAFEATLGKSPIPFYRRFGGLVLLGLIAAIVAVGAISASRMSAQDTVLLAQPQVGDLYTVDLDQLVPDAFDGHAYGVMRVAGVDGETITLQVPQSGYSKWSGADTDARGSRAHGDGYYVPGETLDVPLAQLRRFHDGSGLRHVYR